MEHSYDPTNHNRDHLEKYEKIKANPERALFGEFRGTSPSQAITVWVDILGRLKRVSVEPNTLRSVAEDALGAEFVAAYDRAVDAADFVDFDAAELAHELNDVARGHPSTDEQPPAEAATNKHEPPPRSRNRAQDDEEEDFENMTFLH